MKKRKFDNDATNVFMEDLLVDINGIMRHLESKIPGLSIKRNEPMSAHTTFGIGGPADLLCRPRTVEELLQVLGAAREAGIPSFIIGNGSNLLVRDGGMRGIVIETSALDRITEVGENILEAECGASLTKLAVFALENSLTGIEFAYGIPGTVGGAVYMNAGAYGGEMKQCVIGTDYADPIGEILTLTGDEHCFDYRHSFFTQQKGYTILRTRIRLSAGDPACIKEKMQEFKRRRQESQPLQYPSAGSFFKRPAGYYAGKLISESGLQGCRSGDAQVSEKHAGFIVNSGNATCRDVLDLMGKVRHTVGDKFGVGLEPEVLIIGEDTKEGE